MKKIGKILQLFISIEGEEERTPKDIIMVDEKGVIDDKFYNKNIQRSLLITSTESYQMVKEKGIAIEYGQLGENLLIDYNPYLLPLGSQLQIGEVTLEITQNCTICNHLSKIDKSVPKLLANDRGIFVKVVQGGQLNLNGDIYLIKKA